MFNGCLDQSVPESVFLAALTSLRLGPFSLSLPSSTSASALEAVSFTKFLKNEERLMLFLEAKQGGFFCFLSWPGMDKIVCSVSVKANHSA